MTTIPDFGTAELRPSSSPGRADASAGSDTTVNWMTSSAVEP